MDTGRSAEIATVAIVIEHTIEILIKFGGVDAAGFGNEGEPAFLLGFHFIAQLVRLEGGIALEADFVDFSAIPFINDDDKLGRTGCVRCLYIVGYRYICKTIANVVVEHLAARAENVLITQEAPGFELGDASELTVAEF